MLLSMVLGQTDEAKPALTRAEYDELVRRGALVDAHVQLIDGRIVSRSPQGGPHRYSVHRLAKALVRALGDRADVYVQAPFAVPGESEPEPDVAVVRPATISTITPAARGSSLKSPSHPSPATGRRRGFMLRLVSPNIGS
jgi:Uma2 family endonuclease